MRYGAAIYFRTGKKKTARKLLSSFLRSKQVEAAKLGNQAGLLGSCIFGRTEDCS